MKGRTLKDYIAEQMNDPEFKKAWDDLEPEFQVLKAMIKAREKLGISQAELARRLGTKQSVISRLERGAFSKARENKLRDVANLNNLRATTWTKTIKTQSVVSECALVLRGVHRERRIDRLGDRLSNVRLQQAAKV